MCNHKVPLHQLRFLKYFDHWVSWRPLPRCLPSKPVFRSDLLMIWGNRKTVSNLAFTPVYNQHHLLKPGQDFSAVRKIISRRILQLKAVCWNWRHPPLPRLITTRQAERVKAPGKQGSTKGRNPNGGVDCKETPHGTAAVVPGQTHPAGILCLACPVIFF